MPADEDKVIRILKEFQDLLKQHKPNLAELRMIRNKIDAMVDRNVQRQKYKARMTTDKTQPPPPPKKWVKIPID
ncbi:MAG: hypothetical protein ACFFDT_13105 [Candidatus Hodarchaeota archaeon]